MTEFDNRIVAQNHRSNQRIDRVIDKGKREGEFTTVDVNMMGRVMRPYCHILNECEIKNVDIVKVIDATTMTFAAAVGEMFTRIIPKGNDTMLQDTYETFMQEFTQSLMQHIEANFNVSFYQAPPPAAGTPPLHS